MEASPWKIGILLFEAFSDEKAFKEWVARDLYLKPPFQCSQIDFQTVGGLCHFSASPSMILSHEQLILLAQEVSRGS